MNREPLKRSNGDNLNERLKVLTADYNALKKEHERIRQELDKTRKLILLE